MVIAVVALVLGLILLFVPGGAPPAAPPGQHWTYGGKVNAIGWILVFWGVYLVLVALTGRPNLLR